MGNHKKPAVTLQTIADELNVSRTTISNAFNKPDQLTPELREKILATANRLGYCGPDPRAKSLRTGVSGAIGLVLTESLAYMVTDPAAGQILVGIAEVFDESDLSLLALPTRLDRSSGVRLARDAVVDGFLLNALARDDPRILPVTSRDVPVVVLHGPELEGFGFVGIDDRAGATAIARHIAELGHQRVGLLSYPMHEDNWDGPISAERLASGTVESARDRLQGIAAVMAEHGVGWDDLLTWEGQINNVEVGAMGAGRLLDRAERPTAILALSDQLALGAIEAARTRGLRVPQDVSITGFDDIPAAAKSDPPLTTVRQPLRLAGAMSAKMLLEGWEGDPPRVILPTELIVRASTAPASHV